MDPQPSLTPTGEEDHGKAQGGIVVQSTVGFIKRLRGLPDGMSVKDYLDMMTSVMDEDFPPLLSFQRMARHMWRTAAGIVGGSARQRSLVTSWRFRGDTHTACAATKSPTGATGKTRRTRQRST